MQLDYSGVALLATRVLLQKWLLLSELLIGELDFVEFPMLLIETCKLDAKRAMML